MPDQAGRGQALRDNLARVRRGEVISCGIWPYMMGCRLTCRGYTTLVSQGVKASLFAPDALELRLGKKTALIGMTPALRRKLKLTNPALSLDLIGDYSTQMPFADAHPPDVLPEKRE